MNKQIYFYLTSVVVILIIILGIFILTNDNFSFLGYKHSVSREGVDFVSNVAELSELLQDAKETSTFVISPEFVEKGPENSYMLSTVTMFSAVLAEKEKDFIIIARVIDDNGEITNCQTNMGDVKVNKELSVEECNALLSDSSNTRILISLPEKSLSNPRVVLEKKKISIYPSSFENVSHSTFVLLKALYEDSEEIINRVNAVVDVL